MNLSTVEHFEECFTSEERTTYYDRLLEDIPWTTVQWRRGVPLPRKVFRYDYGTPNRIAVLDELRREVMEMFASSESGETSPKYQPECYGTTRRAADFVGGYQPKCYGIWCNYYPDGSNYTPPHQDQYVLPNGQPAHVITVSFGATRDCIIEPLVKGSGEKVKYTLKDGDIFYFSPEHDATHKHSIPKRKNAGPRISIVFFTSSPNGEDRTPNGEDIFEGGEDIFEGEEDIFEDPTIPEHSRIIMTLMLNRIFGSSRPIE